MTDVLTFSSQSMLSSKEVTDLSEMEAPIKWGLPIVRKAGQALLEVGQALRAIRDDPRKLYRSYGTFEVYCRDKWDIGINYAEKMMRSSTVLSNLQSSTIVPLLPANESQLRPLTSLSPDIQQAVWQYVLEETGGEGITAAKIEKAIAVLMGTTNNVHVSDESYEWYTPVEYVEAVRSVLGNIDLDPASTATANGVVKAEYFFTKEDNGLTSEWFGNVYLNPPYSMPEVEEFANKAIGEWKADRVKAMIILTNNGTDTGWFHSLGSLCNAMCFTKGRINFWKQTPDKPALATRQGQVFFYFGRAESDFAMFFEEHGLVLERGRYIL